MAFIKREIQDAIRDALIGNSNLNDIKVFVRGYAVKPMTNDQYPFCEIIIGSEDDADEFVSGNVYQRTYSGLITFNTQEVGDLLTVTSREANTASYDDLEEYVTYAMLELQEEAHHALSDLTTTLANGSVSIVDVVTHFYLTGPITYGIDDRGNNYENFGSIPFVVETQRSVT